MSTVAEVGVAGSGGSRSSLERAATLVVRVVGTALMSFEAMEGTGGVTTEAAVAVCDGAGAGTGAAADLGLQW